MSKFAITVIISAPEGETQEWNPIVEASSIPEALLRGYSQSVDEFAAFRRKHKLAKLQINDATVHIKEIKE